MTDTLTPTDTRTDYNIDNGDHERLAHYTWTPGQDGDAVVLEAMIEGTHLKALCGKWFVPQRDPSKFPVCKTCKELKAHLKGA